MAQLRSAGFIAMGGQIVDATVVAAPKQRNTEDEKQALRQGRIPEDWARKPAKLRQKDRDARWTVKQGKAKPGLDGAPQIAIAIPDARGMAQLLRMSGLFARAARWPRWCSLRPLQAHGRHPS